MFDRNKQRGTLGRNGLDIDKGSSFVWNGISGDSMAGAGSQSLDNTLCAITDFSKSETPHVCTWLYLIDLSRCRIRDLGPAETAEALELNELAAGAAQAQYVRGRLEVKVPSNNLASTSTSLSAAQGATDGKTIMPGRGHLGLGFYMICADSSMFRAATTHGRAGKPQETTTSERQLYLKVSAVYYDQRVGNAITDTYVKCWGDAGSAYTH